MYIQGVPQFFLALTTRDLLVNFKVQCGGRRTHTQALKSLLDLQTDIGHTKLLCQK